MKRLAILKDGLVVNVVVAHDDYIPPAGLEKRDPGLVPVAKGWRLANNEWVAPPLAPQVVQKKNKLAVPELFSEFTEDEYESVIDSETPQVVNAVDRLNKFSLHGRLIPAPVAVRFLSIIRREGLITADRETEIANKLGE